MKSFKFRLEAVLSLRDAHRKEKLRSFLEQKNIVTDLERNIQDIERAIAFQLKPKTSVIDTALLQSESLLKKALGKKKDYLLLDLEKEMKVLTEVEAIYLEAKSDFESIKKYKEKKKKQHKQEVINSLYKEIEELYRLKDRGVSHETP